MIGMGGVGGHKGNISNCSVESDEGSKQGTVVKPTVLDRKFAAHNDRMYESPSKILLDQGGSHQRMQKKKRQRLKSREYR